MVRNGHVNPAYQLLCSAYDIIKAVGCGGADSTGLLLTS
jgi:hypothetical protein